MGDRGRWSAAAWPRVLLVLLFVLLLVVAWTVGARWAAAHAAVLQQRPCSLPQEGRTGGGPDGGQPGGFAAALLDHHLTAALADHERGAGRPGADRKRADGKAGGADRPWTSYESWDALRKAPAAYDAYWRDRSEARAKLPADWSAVRAEVGPLLQEGREWIGLINLVDGVPRVVHKEPGPAAGGTAGAELPAEVVERVASRPAMYLFHTHPQGLSSMASPVDASTALMGLYGGHYAGHVIVAPNVIALYTPTNRTINRLWDETRPHLAAMRTALDLYSSVAALRSWGTFYSYADFERVCENLGLAYYLFPADGFMQQYYNYVYSSSDWVDTAQLAQFTRRVEKAQAGLEPRSRGERPPRPERVTPHRVAPSPAARPAADR